MESRRNSRSYLNPDYYAQTVALQGPNMLTLHAQRIHQILDNDVEESHPLFSELEVLEAVGDDFEWRENARWIKFEEDVEEGGNRWSKPHVSSLSLHAMFELKEVILHGTIILDMEGETLEEIVETIVNNLINNNKLPFSQRERIKEILLKKHRHQHQRKHHSLAKKGAEKNYYINTSVKKDGDSPVYSEDECQNTVTEKPKYNLAFMRKVPPNAETSNIMVGQVACLDQPQAILVRLKNSCVIGNLTEVPVPTRFISILLVPHFSSLEFFEIGRAIGTLMSDEVFHEVAYKAKNKSDIIFGIEEFMHAVTVLPPGEWDPTIRIEPPAAIPSQDPRKRPPEKEPNEEDEELDAQKRREQTGLARTGILFGGLKNDLKRKLPWYWSDFKDAFSTQSIASWIFLYFACLSPTITFGGLLGEATGHNMGAMESMVSSFICGVGYGFFSGQPLTILGSTGPLLVFEAIIYDFCMTYNWDYLTFRFWIGTWIAVILLILVAIDASAYVCYITRFTEENFAALIALIFIYEAIEKVLSIGEKYPMNTTGNPNVTLNSSCSCMVNITGRYEKWEILNNTECEAFGGFLEGEACFHPPFVPDVYLFSILLTMGTFIISIKLKESKNALFFSASVRTFLSDFAVIIAIASMTFVDFWYKIPTPKLDVPQEFKPTLPSRGWIISPFNQLNPFWSIFFAIAPALLGTILIFMDQQITAVIVNRKEYKLKKGCGYHLDLFVLAILIQICTFMGLPWLVAATVRSINHVNSLKLESECAAPGEKPQFLGVREQRVTNILVFLTVGVSVFLTPFLSHIPMPVLFGVFLYMGISALNDLQLFDRILIVFMPKKYQPDYMFLRQVPVKRVHLFTFIQLSSLISLWLIKSFHQTSILFPLWLVVMVGIRKALDSVFTRRELKILDDLMPTNPKKHVTNGKPGFLEKVSRCFLGPKLVQIDPKYQRCSVIEKETAA